MVIALVAVPVALVLLGAWWLSRRRSTEVHSVEGYQHALSTLQTIRARSTGSSVRVLDPASATKVRIEGDARSRTAGLAGGGSDPSDLARSTAPSNSHTPPGGLVFEDPSSIGAPSARDVLSEHRRRDRSMAAMNRRPRPVGGALVAGLAVVALVVALVVIGSSTSHPHHPAAPATRVATPRTPKRPATHGTTPSTIPARFVAVSSAAFSAQYTPPGSSYTLTVAATSGSCWIQVSDVASGTVVAAQTLVAGQQQSVSADGEYTVVLGAPDSAALTLDGAPVVLPAGARSPLTLTFDPTGSSTAPPTPTTTASSTPAP